MEILITLNAQTMQPNAPDTGLGEIMVKLLNPMSMPHSSRFFQFVKLAVLLTLIGIASIVKAQDGELRRIRVDTSGTSVQNKPRSGQGSAGVRNMDDGAKLNGQVKGKNAVLWHPFGLAGSHLLLAYERKLTDRFSGRLQVAYGLSDNSNYYNVKNLTAWYTELQGRYYFDGSNDSPVGWYGGGYLLYKQNKYEFEVSRPSFTQIESQERSAVGGGILFGVQTALDKQVVMDFYLGCGPIAARTRKELATGVSDPFNDGMFIDTWRNRMTAHFGLAFGFVF